MLSPLTAHSFLAAQRKFYYHADGHNSPVAAATLPSFVGSRPLHSRVSFQSSPVPLMSTACTLTRFSCFSRRQPVPAPVVVGGVVVVGVLFWLVVVSFWLRLPSPHLQLTFFSGHQKMKVLVFSEYVFFAFVSKLARSGLNHLIPCYVIFLSFGLLGVC